MSTPAAGDASTDRSITLLWVFLAASGAILLVGAVLLSALVGRVLREQAVDDAKESVAVFTSVALTPVIVRGDVLEVDHDVLAELAASLRARTDVRSVKVWAPDGTLLFTNVEPERTGTRFPIGEGLARALATRRASGELEELGADESAEEAEAEAGLGLERALEVYAPVLGADGAVLGAYEVYADPGGLEAQVAAGRRTVWLAVLGVFSALYVALALLVRQASRRLRRQTVTLSRQAAELLTSYRRLEQGSLEAIETLNATVDAKDPYTAGHSQRVRRIALAVAVELGLETQLETFGTAALFHDVGKIAVPDAILTKRGPLTDDELEIVRQHAAKGAEIVSKLSSLAEAVPWVRHHHERWDGRGYPDGLRGEAIPLEAAIIGLADAWDAMTTDRPYARARPLAEAFAEVREGRGTQFHPAVVDAFLAVARSGRIEALLGADDEDALVAPAV